MNELEALLYRLENDYNGLLAQQQQGYQVDTNVLYGLESDMTRLRSDIEMARRATQQQRPAYGGQQTTYQRDPYAPRQQQRPVYGGQTTPNYALQTQQRPAYANANFITDRTAAQPQTAKASTSRYSNKNAVSAVPIVEAPGVAPIVTPPKKEVIPAPLEGNEYKPLVTPNHKAVVEIIGEEYFRYAIKEVSMDEKTHNAIYDKTRAAKDASVDKEICINDDFTITRTVKVALDHQQAVCLEGEDNNVLSSTLVCEPIFIKRTTNDKFNSFYSSIITKAIDLSSIAVSISNAMDLADDEVTLRGYERINQFLTKRVASVLKNSLGNKFLGMDDFRVDIFALLDIVKKHDDVRIKSTHEAGFVDILANLRLDVHHLVENKNDVNDENSLLNGELYNVYTIPVKAGIITTKDESIRYELINSETEALSVAKEYVPNLCALLEAAERNGIFKENSTVLVQSNTSVYEIFKSKLSIAYILRKIK